MKILEICLLPREGLEIGDEIAALAHVKLCCLIESTMDRFVGPLKESTTLKSVVVEIIGSPGTIFALELAWKRRYSQLRTNFKLGFVRLDSRPFNA